MYLDGRYTESVGKTLSRKTRTWNVVYYHRTFKISHVSSLPVRKKKKNLHSQTYAVLTQLLWANEAVLFYLCINYRARFQYLSDIIRWVTKTNQITYVWCARAQQSKHHGQSAIALDRNVRIIIIIIIIIGRYTVCVYYTFKHNISVVYNCNLSGAKYEKIKIKRAQGEYYTYVWREEWVLK